MEVDSFQQKLNYYTDLERRTLSNPENYEQWKNNLFGLFGKANSYLNENMFHFIEGYFRVTLDPINAYLDFSSDFSKKALLERRDKSIRYLAVCNILSDMLNEKTEGKDYDYLSAEKIKCLQEETMAINVFTREMTSYIPRISHDDKNLIERVFKR